MLLSLLWSSADYFAEKTMATLVLDHTVVGVKAGKAEMGTAVHVGSAASRGASSPRRLLYVTHLSTPKKNFVPAERHLLSEIFYA